MGTTHARAIRAAGGRVHAAVGSGPSRANHAAAAVGASIGYESVHGALSDSAVDVVHICTPNSSHAAIAIEAMEAGKDVVCEKPMATTGADAARIYDASRRTGRKVTVPFVYRFHPLVREIRERVRLGGLGLAAVAHGSYLQDWLAHPETMNWRVDIEDGGVSRAFADIGSHWCDLFEFISGQRIGRVSAQFSTLIEGRTGMERVTTEDVAVVQFITTEGMLGSVVLAQVAAGRKNRLVIELSGTKASYVFDQERPDSFWLGGLDASQLIVRDSTKLGGDAARLSFLPAGHPQGYQDCFNSFVADSYEYFCGATPVGLPVVVDGLRAAHLVDAVVASARSGGEWSLVSD